VLREPWLSEDEVWLDQLWREYRPLVRRFLARLVQDENVIDELTQQTFVEAWCTRAHRPVRSLPWLYTVARNLVYDHWRERERGLAMWRKLLADPLFDDGGIGLTELNGDVARAWSTLKEKDRQCLQLSVIDALTDEDIAAVMRTTPENVRQRRHRARDKLRAALAEMDDRRAGNRSAAGRR
jgi:RNA polymerase sigma-70 factor, ECF subfamily